MRCLACGAAALRRCCPSCWAPLLLAPSPQLGRAWHGMAAAGRPHLAMVPPLTPPLEPITTFSTWATAGGQMLVR